MEPATENIDGTLVETHSFSHEVEHSVRWDYLAGIVLVGVIGAFIVRSRGGDDEVVPDFGGRDDTE
jgi:hypothetical protein